MRDRENYVNGGHLRINVYRPQYIVRTKRNSIQMKRLTSDKSEYAEKWFSVLAVWTVQCKNCPYKHF